MSSRGNLVLLLLVMVCKVSAQTSVVHVQVYDDARLQPSNLQEFVRRTQDILAGAGLSVQVKACTKSPLPTCDIQTVGIRCLVLRVVPGTARKMNNAVWSPLGQSFADGAGGTYASVFLAPAQDQAAAVDVSWVIVLSYAAAHEVGHLLLGDHAHTPRGLMKAHWDKNDYRDMNQNRFHFSDEQVRELTGRFGITHSVKIGSSVALEVRQ